MLHCKGLRGVRFDQLVMEGYGWRRIDKACMDRKENTILQEHGGKCLVLAPKWNTIHFEVDVKLGAFRNGIERVVKAEADACLFDSMSVPIESSSASGTMDLHQNLVTYTQYIIRN